MRSVGLILSVLLILNSCSIEKRLYNDGYSVNWRNAKLIENPKKNYGSKVAMEVNKKHSNSIDTSHCVGTDLCRHSPSSVARVDSKKEVNKNNKDHLSPKISNIVKVYRNAKEQMELLEKANIRKFNKNGDNEDATGDIHWTSIVSVVCAVLFYLFLFFALTSEALVLVVLSVMFAVLAFFLGSVGVKKSKSKAGETLGKIGKIMGKVELLIFATFLLLALLAVLLMLLVWGGLGANAR